MSIAISASSADSTLSSLVGALRGELLQLQRLPNSALLFSGRFVHEFAGCFYYRFELPEHVLLRGIDRVTLLVGRRKPASVACEVVSVENQYLTLALPVDFGPTLPRAECRWNYAQWLEPVLTTLEAVDVRAPLVASLLDPSNAHNGAAPSFTPSFLPTTPAPHQEAIVNILKNRVTLLWGPARTGKTNILALVAVNAIKNGKSVLLVAPTGERVDAMLVAVDAIGRQLAVEINRTAARVGYSILFESDPMKTVSLECQVNDAKTQLGRDNRTLVEKYWKTKTKEILHEDYFNRLDEMRNRGEELKRQLEEANAALATLQEKMTKLESASMLEKMKRAYKDELALTQKQLNDKQNQQKRLQSQQAALMAEILKTEAQSPVRGEQAREFQALLRLIEEAGGFEKVQTSVEEIGIAEGTRLLNDKRLVGATLAVAVADPRIRDKSFDVVMVDDAEAASLPLLTALAARARERFILAGDPYQAGPESVTNNEAAQRWLQRDVFRHVAATDELPGLFDWSARNPERAIFLSTQYATTPKLAPFVASLLFDDKLNVVVAPEAKGKLYFIDTSNLKSSCKQYAGRQKVLPYNDVQTRRTMECIKHALMEHRRRAVEVGVIHPFAGPTLYTKLQLRLLGLSNIEVGTPQTFRGRRKKAIVFDTAMAGVDYTVRTLDDKKVGEQKIVSLLNTVFSCVEDDLYIVADMSHFQDVYKGRLFTKLLTLLQARADPPPNFAKTNKLFDDIEWEELCRLSAYERTQTVESTTAPQTSRMQEKIDHELELRMKMLAKQQTVAQTAAVQNVERDIFRAVLRVLGYRTDLNLLSQFVGGGLLFDVTLASEAAAARLPLDSCKSEKEFREAMERWNLLIYELSGGSRSDVAYFSTQTPEARVRADINSLSAFYTPGAALEEGKQKLAMAVAKVFQETLGKPLPGNPTEWSTGYRSILGKLEAYLSWIAEQIRK